MIATVNLLSGEFSTILLMVCTLVIVSDKYSIRAKQGLVKSLDGRPKGRAGPSRSSALGETNKNMPCNARIVLVSKMMLKTCLKYVLSGRLSYVQFKL